MKTPFTRYYVVHDENVMYYYLQAVWRKAILLLLTMVVLKLASYLTNLTLFANVCLLDSCSQLVGTS